MIHTSLVLKGSNIPMRTRLSRTCLIAVCLPLVDTGRRRKIWTINEPGFGPDLMKSAQDCLQKNSNHYVTLATLLGQQPVVCSWVRTSIRVPIHLRPTNRSTTSLTRWAIRFALRCPDSCLILLDLQLSEVLVRVPEIQLIIRRRLRVLPMIPQMIPIRINLLPELTRTLFSDDRVSNTERSLSWK